MGTKFSQSDIVEGKPGITDAFMEVYANISRSTAGDRVMGAAGCVGICCNKE